MPAKSHDALSGSPATRLSAAMDMTGPGTCASSPSGRELEPAPDVAAEVADTRETAPSDVLSFLEHEAQVMRHAKPRSPTGAVYVLSGRGLWRSE